jgi:hypothetical protein
MRLLDLVLDSPRCNLILASSPPLFCPSLFTDPTVECRLFWFCPNAQPKAAALLTCSIFPLTCKFHPPPAFLSSADVFSGP